MDDLKNFYDEVARVAYELYEKRGRIHGHDLEDWLQAETIVKNRLAQGKISPHATDSSAMKKMNQSKSRGTL